MVEAILAPYVRRIERRQDLSRNMMLKLETYPIMVELIRRAVFFLEDTERQQGAPCLMSRQRLYAELLKRHSDLVEEALVTLPGDTSAEMAEHVNFFVSIGFTPKPIHPFHVFNEAMTVAKRVGLIAGWGRSGLDPEVRAKLNRASRKAVV